MKKLYSIFFALVFSVASYSQFSTDLELLNSSKKINYSEKNTLIQGSDIKLRDNKLLSFNKVIVRTEVDGVKNNDFSLSFDKKVMIKGRLFDASNFNYGAFSFKYSDIFPTTSSVEALLTCLNRAYETFIIARCLI